MYIICQSTCVEDKLKKKYGNACLKDYPYDIDGGYDEENEPLLMMKRWEGMKTKKMIGDEVD